MLVLVINAGSSSIKYQLLEMDNASVIAKGLVERIGIEGGVVSHKYLHNGEYAKKDINQNLPTHAEGMKLVVDLLTDKEIGVISNPEEVKAVGHRVVQGCEYFQGPVVITDDVKKKIEDAIPLAPLHNGANLLGIEVSEGFFPNATQVAVFDTAYHQTMPQRAFRYAIPNKFYTDHQVRAYGAHGTSHKFVRNEVAKHIGKADAKVITVHLGNGASITAINEKGESIDTSMGFTPLNGLLMGTRSGDIDPSVLIYLVKQCGVKFEELDDLLNKQSGMQGMTGYSDCRDVLERYYAGDKDAIACIELYTYRIKKYIGSYLAALNGADAIAFTAGVGENAEDIRSFVCKDLEGLGIKMDEQKNIDLNHPSEPVEVQAADSKIKILVVPTNEELEIANNAVELMK